MMCLSGEVTCVSLKIEDKKTIVAEVGRIANSAIAAAAAEYRGMKVSELTQLRIKARHNNINLKVVRNTLARLAFQGTSFECMHDALVGPLILAFSSTEPSAPARLFRDYAKTNEKLSVKIIALDGRLLDVKDLDRIANLPTRNEALSILMAVMKAPFTKLVRTMVEPHAKLVRTIAAIREKKQAE